MTKIHGQSESTEEKQNQLRSLLQGCYYAWEKEHAWAHPTRLFLDCMAGSGHTKDGDPGSPIILQDFANTLSDTQVVWCEENRKLAAQLEKYKQGNTELLVGRYQTEMRSWLNHFTHRHGNKVMGLVYLDDNGCKQIWEDDGFLDWVMSKFPYLDIAIYFSESAWLRNNQHDWAKQDTVTDLLWRVLAFKPGSLVYFNPVKHRFHLVYGVRSTKMNLTGYKREKLRDYLERLREQLPLIS